MHFNFAVAGETKDVSKMLFPSFTILQNKKQGFPAANGDRYNFNYLNKLEITAETITRVYSII